MAITRVSSQDASAVTGTLATVTATYPGATTAGHLLIALATSNVGTGINTISGWTLLVEQATSSNQSLSLFYKLATGSETTVQLSATGSTGCGLQIYEYSGNANPIATDGTAAGSVNNSNGTSLATAAITTANANDLIFTGGWHGTNFGSNVSSWTHATLLTDINTGGGHRFAGGQNIVSTTQTGYTDTYTYTGTSSTNMTLIAAFQAAGGGGGSGSDPLELMLLGVG